MKTDKYPLYITDMSGSEIQEPAIQFILSLAPGRPVIIKDITDIFEDNKIGKSYFLARQEQLNQSMAHSIKSGQYSLYENIYKPSTLRTRQILATGLIKQDELEMDKMAIRIDKLNSWIADYVSWSKSEPFTVTNKSHVSAIMACIKLSMNPFDLVNTEFEHSSLVKTICLALKCSYNRVFEPIEHGIIKTTPYIKFAPNYAKMQAEVFADGYFTDNIGRRYYCEKKTAKAAAKAAVNSKLSAMKLANEQELSIIHICTHTGTFQAVQQRLGCEPKTK